MKELGQRELFTLELQERLRAKIADEDIIAQVVEHLSKKKLLDDRRAAEAVIRRYSGRRAVGRERLEQILRGRGAPEEVMDVIPREENVEVLVREKFPQGAAASKIARFLASRGFSEDAIEAFLDQSIG